MCIKVVKSLVFGSIFLARNDYIKLVTLQTCWMHLQFVLVVFQITLCPIEMNGKYEVKSIKIDPEVIDPDDVEMLEDLILAALKDGFEQVAKNSESSMSDITGGMKIPGLF